MGEVVGLEIAPSRAAMVHVRPGRHGVVVRQFAWIDHLSGVPELTARLTSLRREHRLPKRACVVAWGGGERAQGLASSVRRAGFRIEALLSPAEAMRAALDRGASPGVRSTGAAGAAGPAAYLLLHADGGHLAVAIGDRVVMERPVRFTYPTLQSTDTRQRLLHRYTMLAAIVAVLEPAFREVKRVHARGVRQIVTCGSLPELRSLTMPLAEEFDVEVETLDGIHVVDATKLPEPADAFRDRAAALQLALAAVMRPVTAVRGTSFALVAAMASLVLVALVAWFAQASRDGNGPTTAPLTAAPTDVASASAGTAGTAGRAEPYAPPRLRLQAIRVSQGRRVAVINGTVVGTGDRVDGVTVFDIGPSVVVVRDAAGRLSTVTR